MIHFILGGARSGKSRFAEKLVLQQTNKQGKQPVYIATASAIDAEMASRISQHQDDRADNWQLIECPLALTDTLADLDCDKVYLLDCLTLWLNNQLYAKCANDAAQQKQHLQAELEKLIRQLSSVSADIIVVSNEIGLGVIPMGESTRLYVDYCGWLNQGVAKVSDKVTLVTAGIPLVIKDNIGS